jgi:hypothetical protein
MKPSNEINPEVTRFIKEVINHDDGRTLSDKKFADIVDTANSKGYKLTDTELLHGLNQYYDNQLFKVHR